MKVGFVYAFKLYCVPRFSQEFVNESIKPDGWYRAFLKEPRGAIRVGGDEIAVRAVRIGSERLRDAIDRAYLEKYCTPGALKYAKDLGRAKSRATTIELVPLVRKQPNRAAN